MKRLPVFLFLTGCALLAQAQHTASPSRNRMDLSGPWESSLGTCVLPGTTDENHLGTGASGETYTDRLTREYPFVGQVTYSRTIDLPANLANRHLVLRMERTKPSTLWVDGDSIGSIGQLYAAHEYSLTPIQAGKHEIRIRINNRDDAVPEMVHGSHAWSESTQTNWNGILGEFCIQEIPAVCVRSLQVYPDVDNRKALVNLTVTSEKTVNATLSLQARLQDLDRQLSGEPYPQRLTDDAAARPVLLKEKIRLHAGQNELSFTLNMGEDMKCWSEFHPYLNQLTASITSAGIRDAKETLFGMRKFQVQDTQFRMNDYITFLRGTHDACVFPLTAYCPTDVDEWLRVFRIARQYGINHYRFHSYTPTEACFIAADMEGIYLQCELPGWGTVEKRNTAACTFLLNEAHTLLDAFGNHPSFLMMGLGNELGGEVETMREWLDLFRAQDPRHLYCFGSNNWLGWKGPQDGEDYFVTCRVGGGEGFSTHVRSSFSFADADNGGILNTRRPGTSADYTQAIRLCPRPVVSHESAQFQIYPDYSELPKYTGVLRPYNLETFRARLNGNGLQDQIQDFHQSTGRWAVDCFKADNEYCLRTPGFGGFQMLDIKDYPGQGTALVGILDAFMDSKGLISPEDFRTFCSPLSLLARMDSLCIQADKGTAITLTVANYLEHDYTQDLNVLITDPTDGRLLVEGRFTGLQVPQGAVAKVGTLRFSLPGIRQPQKVNMELRSGEYRNSYQLWVYPELTQVQAPEELLLADTLSADVLTALEQGARVLLTPRHRDILDQSVGGLFTPDYWNYAMFKTISENNNRPVSPGTLGMLMDPGHPLFREFPTDGRSGWQWWCIALNSRPLILNTLPRDYRPLIQVVDNVERNHKLGTLLECRVGQGRLLICTTDLTAISPYLEGRWYRKALMDYMCSPEFQPALTLTPNELRDLLTRPASVRDIQGVKNESDYQIPQDKP